MFPLRESLSLSRTWTEEDEVVVISWFEWQRVHAESGYHEIDSHRALWMLTSLDCHRLMEARHFISDLRLNSFPLSQMDDHEELELIRQALNNRRLVAIQKGAEQPVIPSVTVQLRRLVAQVEKATHGKLFHQGRQYKLVVDVELASTPGRDYYEVASQSEARAALDSVAKISPASADLLKQARDKLTKDWSPPSQPDGLILLRRVQTQSAPRVDTGPAITPSQMKALIEAATRGKGPLWVRIDMAPKIAEEVGAKFVLTSSDSSISITKTVKDDMEPGNETIDLVYDDLWKDLSYSLRVEGMGSAAAHLFDNIPYDALGSLQGLCDDETTVDETTVVDEESYVIETVCGKDVLSQGFEEAEK